MTSECFEVIVIGGGHAGAEAAHAAAQLGSRTALLTMSAETIAQMSCNPAIGGLAKGQIVREVDALGGIMGLAADAAGIQFRMLNRSKGPAVWAPRAQADRWLYSRVVRETLENCPNLEIVEDTADELMVEGGQVKEVLTGKGRRLGAGAVILTAGTFLRGLMHLGEQQWGGGRINEPSADKLSGSLIEAGLKLERLKTGTAASSGFGEY